MSRTGGSSRRCRAGSRRAGLVRGERRVARVERGMTRIARRERRRRRRVAALAGPDPVRAEAPDRLQVPEPLERAEMPLVQVPRLDDRNRRNPHRLERDAQRIDAAAQHRGEAQIRAKAFRAEQLTGAACLLLTAWGQRDVGPAGEPMVAIPGALAVPEKYEGLQCRLRGGRVDQARNSGKPR